MLKYPISTILWLSKINIKDKIKDILKLDDNIKVYIELTVKDRNGKIIKHHKQYSHSFVANFLNGLAESFAQASITTSTNIFASINTSNTSVYDFGWYNINAPAGNSSFGIVIGTGNATPTPQDYQLGNQIANGTGSGQMIYNATSFNPSSGTVTISGNTSSIQISRTFQNESGASITVSETGIISITDVVSGTSGYILIVHDLLSSPITIPNGGVMAITYTISVTT